MIQRHRPYSVYVATTWNKPKAAINDSKHWLCTVIAALCFIPYCGHINVCLFVLSLFWIKLFQYISTGLPRGPDLNKHIYKLAEKIFNKQGNKNMCNLKTNETIKKK